MEPIFFGGKEIKGGWVDVINFEICAGEFGRILGNGEKLKSMYSYG